MNSPASPTHTVIVEKEMPHPPAKIWRALTDSSLIDQWLLSNDFQPIVGHKFTLRATPMPNWTGIIDCEVLVVEPPSRLSYTWASMGLGTVVTWTLSATQGGTRLRMEQAGFKSPTDANYQGATYGWQKFIGHLEQVVAETN
jgi:uncharacterized protein YndB with AHSA1/START domain